jgi:hypothetical protein
VNPVFETPAFWQPYLTLEPGDVTAEDFTAQFDTLRREFPVREEVQTIKRKGRSHRFVDYFVEFRFACGERFSIVLEYEVSPDLGCTKELSLADARSGQHHLGWWDQARWHPYCLRADELDALIRHWQRHDPRWPNPHVPLLLLCQFVGPDDDAAVKALTSRADAAWRALDLPTPRKGRHAVELEVPEPRDYRWELDDEHGWVFTSEEYCCYSVRNRPHAGGEEGRFPFRQFREMMEHVRAAG